MLQIKYIIVMEHTAIMSETYPADLAPEASILRIEMVHGKVEKVTHIPPPGQDYSSLEERVCAHLAKGSKDIEKGVEAHRQLAHKDMFKQCLSAEESIAQRIRGSILVPEARERLTSLISQAIAKPKT